VLGPELTQIQPDFNDVTKHLINVLWDVNPADQPLRREAAALTAERQESGRDFQIPHLQVIDVLVVADQQPST
jgi:hypothetical protein